MSMLTLKLKLDIIKAKLRLLLLIILGVILLSLTLTSCCLPFTSCQYNSDCLKADIRGNLYKRATFRSWLLLNSPDTRYTPYELSSAINVRTTGNFKRTAIKNDQKQWQTLDETVNTPLIPCDYGTDINPFLERIDLKNLAKICCQGMKGHLYFIPGRRSTPTFNSQLSGLVSGFSPFIPASFQADGNIMLSRFLDNIWLLYQLEQHGWIEVSGTKNNWQWSNKAKGLQPPMHELSTLHDMPDKLKLYFVVLSLIDKNNYPNAIPHIPYTLIETNEEISERVNELRDGEGYVYDIGQYEIYSDVVGLTAKNSEEEQIWQKYISSFSCFSTLKNREKGIRIMINSPDSTQYLPYYNHFKDTRDAPYLFEFYVSSGELEKYPPSDNSKRNPILIYYQD